MYGCVKQTDNYISVKVKRLKPCITLNRRPASDLCGHVVSHRTCLTLTSVMQAGLPTLGDGRLSWPGWLVIYQDGLPVRQ